MAEPQGDDLRLVDQVPRADLLRIVQLNAGSLLEPDWTQRRHEIVAWLQRLDPDVVCLQEVWEDARGANTAGWLAEHSGGPAWHWHFAGDPFDPSFWPDPSLRFGSAILSRWPIELADHHRLPLDDEPDAFAAAVPWELVRVRTADIDVFSCHLASAPHHARHRRRQVLAIDHHIRAARGDRDADAGPGAARAHLPAILCGDFNAEPDSDEIRFLTAGTVLEGQSTFYQDAWRVAGDGSAGHTQDWRTNPIAASLNVHRKRIDYVFVGDPFLRSGHAGRILRAERALDEPLTGIVASDHVGLVVDVVWPTRPTEVDSAPGGVNPVDQRKGD